MEELTKAEGTPEDATMDVPLLTLKEVNMPMNLVVIHALFCRHLWIAKSDRHVLDTGTAYLLLYNCASTKEVDLIEGDILRISALVQKRPT